MNETRGTMQKLSRLRPHPEQASLFGDLPDDELRRLADDIDREGLKNPIEILPDRTIITGHNRVRAARLLGWVSIAVIVRRDLAEGGDSSVLGRMIGENLARRQLSPLGQARALLRLDELGQASTGGRTPA